LQWYRLAADRGLPEARYNLNFLQAPGRNQDAAQESIPSSVADSPTAEQNSSWPPLPRGNDHLGEKREYGSIRSSKAC